LAVIAKAATFKKDMLSVLDNTTAALWTTVLRVVSTQRLLEVNIYLAVLHIYPWLYAGDELVRPATLAGVFPGCLPVVDALHPGPPLHLGLGTVVSLFAC